MAALGFHAVFEAAFFDGTIAEAGGQGDEQRGFGGDEGQPKVRLGEQQNGDQEGASREGNVNGDGDIPAIAEGQNDKDEGEK